MSGTVSFLLEFANNADLVFRWFPAQRQLHLKDGLSVRYLMSQAMNSETGFLCIIAKGLSIFDRPLIKRLVCIGHPLQN